MGDDLLFKCKLKEIIYVLVLECYMDKDLILLDYLNVLLFGCNNKG